MKRELLLKAEPEPIKIDLRRTATIVVDMQNAFCSKGGMFDLLRMDITPIRQIIEPCRNVVDTMRSNECKIIYLQMGFDQDLHASGGPNSPYWYKGKALRMMREHPEMLDGKPLVFGTYDADFIPELKPEKGDIVIKKQRLSGFYGTNLDQTLFTYSIKYLVFVGVATNICVESTLRDAFFRDYFSILVSDAVQTGGPDYCQKATLYNVKNTFGWVTTSQDLIKTLLANQQ
jgi:ureidoacrylate peracid hydrolase